MLRWLSLMVFVGLISCNKEINNEPIDSLPQNQLPSHFDPIPYPSDNVYTEKRWQLGKSLFFDVSLSVDSSISCATCHRQAFAFGHDQATTKGVFQREGIRNVPSLANIGYHPYFTREGGVPTLEMQVLVPVQEHHEFGFNMVELTERLSKSEQYQRMAMEAFQRPLDAFVITRALANFERSIVSCQSKYDRYLQGKEKLSSLEKKGMELFFSERTACANCHSGFNFTNYRFENNGLYDSYADEGRARLTGKESDIALFKVPSLRNLSYTAPYMHDGSMTTIDEILNHYNSGGKPHQNKSILIKKLNLSQEDMLALKSFLLTLNDSKLIESTIFH